MPIRSSMIDGAAGAGVGEQEKTINEKSCSQELNLIRVAW